MRILPFTAWFDSQRLLALAFGVVLGVGIWLRVDGIQGHVTYIDELLLLTEGQLVPTQQEISPKSALAYGLATVSSPTNSYAPIALMLTRLIQGPQMFSREALGVLRGLSALFSCLALLGLAHLIWLSEGRRWSSVGLWVFTLFACEMIHWMNAKQGHTYSAGVFGVVLLLELFEFNQRKDSMTSHLMFALGAFIATWLQYQLVLLVLSMGVVGTWMEFRKREHRGKKPKPSPLFWGYLGVTLYAFGMLVFLSRFKSALMVPQWLSPFMVPSSSWGAALKAFFFNLKDIFTILHLTYWKGENLFLAWAGLTVSAVGWVGMIQQSRAHQKELGAGRLSLVLFLFFWWGAFFLKKTPLSPTRHAMVYTIPLLMILGMGLKEIAKRLPLGVISCLCWVASCGVIAVTVKHFPIYQRISRETFDVSQLATWRKTYGYPELATWPFDYSKLWLWTEGLQGGIQRKWAWPGHLEMLPLKSYLLIEGNCHSGAFTPEVMRQTLGFSIRPLGDITQPFDFEPMDKITYGSNTFRVWLLSPKVPNRSIPEEG